MNFSQIVFILVLIALNAFFVAVEFAVVASRRARLDLLHDSEARAATLVRRWMEDDAARDRLVAASQLGIALVSLALGAVSVDAFRLLLQPHLAGVVLPAPLALLEKSFIALPLLLTLLVVASLHVVLGEQVPKGAVLHSPERFAVWAAPVMHGFISIFRGYIFLLNRASHAILRLFGLPVNGNGHTPAISLDELKQIVSGPEVEGVINPPEREMITAVIGFRQLVARQVSIPRTEIVAVEAAGSIAEAVRTASLQGVTKLPVYEENLDQIVGILHMKDLLPAMLEDLSIQKRSARELARDALFVPESIPVSDLLVHMRSRRQHIAITLDEFGGTAGLVTLEDLLEEIVGEVQDSFDIDPPQIQPLPDGAALVDGKTLIEEINQFFHLALYDPNYDTIAGYMLGRLGRMAQVGDVVEDPTPGIRLKVESMDRLRIARIHLSRL